MGILLALAISSQAASYLHSDRIKPSPANAKHYAGYKENDWAVAWHDSCKVGNRTFSWRRSGAVVGVKLGNRGSCEEAGSFLACACCFLYYRRLGCRTVAGHFYCQRDRGFRCWSYFEI